ncbi:hypothetical protein KDA11_03880, partial [Candidatus Saccharibacteria bacterium]|nr:hypothetical protein [Candidatus Saccharibacteria bacterium]
GGSSSPRNWYIHVKKITCPQLFVCSVGPIAQDNVYLYCKEMSCTAIAIDMTNVATSELNISGRIITTAATVIDLATTTISALRFIRASLINTGAGSPVARSGTAIVPQNHGPLMVRVAIPASVFSSTIGSATLINPSYS